MNCASFLCQRFLTPHIDIQEQQRRKSAICIIMLMVLFSTIWGVIYLLFFPIASLGPIIYLATLLLSFLICYIFKIYYPLVHITIGLLILAPTLVHILHGSLHNTSVLIWTTLPPIAGIFLLEKKGAMILWFFVQIIVIYTLLIFRESLYALIDPYITPPIPLYHDINIFLNTVISALVFIFSLALSRKRTYEIEENLQFILYDIYPHHIAKKIFESEILESKAIEYKSANIIFIKFIPPADDTQQEAFATTISNLFRTIDYQAEKHNVYKLKTISKVYLAGTELFDKSTIDNLIAFACSIKRIIASINEYKSTNITYNIGINSGHIVASIIGKKKKVYDVWGDAVNVASRLSNTKYTNEVIISQHSYKKSKCEYKTTPHTLRKVKGKGTLEVYSIKAP